MAARRFRGMLLDVPAVAERLGVTEKTVRARIGRGQLPHRRLGGRVLVHAGELEKFLAGLPGLTAAQALRNMSTKNEPTR